MRNHWVITRDLVENGRSVGTRRVDYSDGLRPEELPVLFRMYDGDGVLCYEGRMTDRDFDPLDDFGMGYAGCTSVK